MEMDWDLVSETERALQGRYSCIAQGASPGLIIDIHLLSSVGAALSQRMQSHEPQLNKPNARAESAAPTELLFFLPCVPRVLFVPLALSPPWALQEYRAYGTRH